MIPVIIAGAMAVGGGIAHHKAKKTNEEAEAIIAEAEDLYEEQKEELENTTNEAKKAMTSLGQNKQKVLKTSMVRFLRGWERIKDIQFTESNAITEIQNFTISTADVVEINSLVTNNNASFKAGASGAAAGGFIAIAAGSVAVPVVAVFTAAPALLFSGLSKCKQAQENYENALVTKYQVEEAVEKMKTSQTLYKAITKRSEMFETLLLELDLLFSRCAYALDRLTRKKNRQIKKIKTLDVFTEEEIKLFSITRSLAGAIKSILDTPILNEKGSLAKGWDSKYKEVEASIPSFSSDVKLIENKGIVPASAPKITLKESKSTGDLAKEIIRNLFGLLLSFAGAGCFYYFFNNQQITYSPDCIFYSCIILTICLLLFIKADNSYSFFRIIRNLTCIGLSILATMGMLILSNYIGPTKFWIDLLIGFIAFLCFGFFYNLLDTHRLNILRLLVKLLGFIVLMAAANLLAGYSIVKWPGFLSIAFLVLSIIASFLSENRALDA